MRDNAAEFLRGIQQIDASHREPFYFLEHAKVRVEAGRVVYWTEHGERKGFEFAYSIPYCNLAVLLLGNGCSISGEAVELLAAANVVIGYTGGGATPLNAGVEPIVFSAGASEYRPTQYMQGWASWWFDENERLQRARSMLAFRARLMEQLWGARALKDPLKEPSAAFCKAEEFFGSRGQAATKAGGLFSSKAPPSCGAEQYARSHLSGETTEQLLGKEGAHVKALYAFMAKRTGISFNSRQPRAGDAVNRLLTMGNYIAYGLAAVALHALGISFAFPLLHGKTRRGALVFDVADPIKDAIVVPMAFACAAADADESTYRSALKSALTGTKALSLVIDHLKEIALGQEKDSTL